MFSWKSCVVKNYTRISVFLYLSIHHLIPRFCDAPLSVKAKRDCWGKARQIASFSHKKLKPWWHLVPFFDIKGFHSSRGYFCDNYWDDAAYIEILHLPGATHAVRNCYHCLLDPNDFQNFWDISSRLICTCIFRSATKALSLTLCFPCVWSTQM